MAYLKMLKSRTNDLKSLTCSLCDGGFIIPRTLPCLHSFCERCLNRQIVKEQANTNGKLSYFNCPTCRTRVTPARADLKVGSWAACFPRNELLEVIVVIKNEGLKSCDICERLKNYSEASNWCFQCTEALCDNCRLFHSGMKMSATHHVVPIKELENNWINYRGVSENCAYHPSKQIDHYCSDHKELCCSNCLSSRHRECRLVESFDFGDVFHLGATYLEKIETIRETMITVKETEETSKAQLKTISATIKTEAKEHVDNAKRKLDSLFEQFNQELDTYIENEITYRNKRIRSIKGFIACLDHWAVVTSKMQENASENQIFILMKTLQSNVDSYAKEVSRVIGEKITIPLKFNQSNLIGEIASSVCIGSLITKETYSTMKNFHEDVDVKSSFEETIVRKENHIQFKGADLLCGICIDETLCVVAGNKKGSKLYVLNINDKKIKSFQQCPGIPKRICYDSKNNRLFISCNALKLFLSHVCQGNISVPERLNSGRNFVGDMCVLDDHVFIIMDGAIKAFSSLSCSKNDEEMSECFKANPCAKGLGGLVAYGQNLIYTTEDNTIKCTTQNGKLIFCNSSPDIEKPISLCCLTNGCILVLDAGSRGKIHLISADGQRNKTLLDGFEDVQNPKDMWLHPNGSSFFVCGSNGVAVYLLVVSK